MQMAEHILWWLLMPSQSVSCLLMFQLFFNLHIFTLIYIFTYIFILESKENILVHMVNSSEREPCFYVFLIVWTRFKLELISHQNSSSFLESKQRSSCPFLLFDASLDTNSQSWQQWPLTHPNLQLFNHIKTNRNSDSWITRPPKKVGLTVTLKVGFVLWMFVQNFTAPSIK